MLEHRNAAPAKVGCVLDVVVKQKCVMEQLEGCGRAYGLVRVTPGGPGGREAYGGAKPFSFAKRVIRQKVMSGP